MALFDFLKTSADKTEQALAPDGPGVDVATVLEAIQLFPIGDPIQYYPEYHQDDQFETVVLGFQLNKNRLYTNQSLSWTEKKTDSDKPSATFHVNGGSTKLKKLSYFAFIVPDNTRTSLEYKRRNRADPKIVEQLIRDFKRGNTITLLSTVGQQGTSEIDTVVDRIITLSDGVYAGQRVALLVPLSNSIKTVDRREHARIDTNLKVRISTFPNAEEECASTMVDFSECAYGIKFPEDAQFREKIIEETRFILCFETGAAKNSFKLLSAVTQLKGEVFVVRPIAIEKNEKLEPIEKIDLLMLKASLMQS